MSSKPSILTALPASRLLWATAGVVGLSVALWWFRGVLMLAFASVLIGIALSALADGLARLTRAPRQVALAAVIVLTLAFVGGTLALFGWRIADQFDQILAKAQASLAALSALAREHQWTRELLARVNGAQFGSGAFQIAPALATTVGSIGRAAAYTGIVAASGVFLAIQPGRHVRGALLLVPPPQRALAAAFLNRAGELMRKWLLSRLIVMLAIGVMSSLGLVLLHVPGALTLGLVGGLLTFIPLIGALIAMAPAILVGFAQSPLTALYVALMYWAVHFIEGTFITPYVQDEETELPPVLTMYSALIAAALFGALGVFLSSPAALMVILALRVFYIERQRPAPDVAAAA